MEKHPCWLAQERSFCCSLLSSYLHMVGWSPSMLRTTICSSFGFFLAQDFLRPKVCMQESCTCSSWGDSNWILYTPYCPASSSTYLQRDLWFKVLSCSPATVRLDVNGQLDTCVLWVQAAIQLWNLSTQSSGRYSKMQLDLCSTNHAVLLQESLTYFLYALYLFEKLWQSFFWQVLGHWLKTSSILEETFYG